MDNLCFVIWMIGWPLACALEGFIYEKFLQRQYSDGVKGFASLFNLIVWFCVAKLLYV